MQRIRNNRYEREISSIERKETIINVYLYVICNSLLHIKKDTICVNNSKGKEEGCKILYFTVSIVHRVIIFAAEKKKLLTKKLFFRDRISKKRLTKTISRIFSSDSEDANKEKIFLEPQIMDTTAPQLNITSGYCMIYEPVYGCQLNESEKGLLEKRKM